MAARWSTSIAATPAIASRAGIGLREASSTVVLNDDVRQRVLAVAPELTDRLRNVPPGVDCSVFRPFAVRGGPSLAYVGRISADKGVFLLVGCFPAVAAAVPGVSLRMVGDGPARPLLEQLTMALGCRDFAAAENVLRQAVQPVDGPWVAGMVRSWHAAAVTAPRPLDVSFTGQLAPAEVAERMAAADVVVVPSLVREAFPLVVLEALASGTPPLAVDVGGLGAVLDEVVPQLGMMGGLLALPGDPERLVTELPSRVAAMLSWLGVPGHRDAARILCRTLAVDNYSSGRVGDRLESLYADAAAASLVATG